MADLPKIKRSEQVLAAIGGEIRFEAVRSRGPGGQNVNKVSSAAILYWHIGASNAVSFLEKDRLYLKLARWINKEGEIHLRSDMHRDLEQNKRQCRERLGELLEEAFHVPKERKATKPTWGSRERKLTAKRHRGEIKKTRGRKDWE